MANVDDALREAAAKGNLAGLKILLTTQNATSARKA